MARQIYLGKDGQTFGPYSDQDLAKFQTSGEIKGYSWMWDSENPGWKSLESLMPPPPPGHSAPLSETGPEIRPETRPETRKVAQTPVPQPQPSPAKTISITATRNLRPAFFAEDSSLEVTCSDRTDVVTGQIFAISENGCHFIGKGINTKRCFAEQEVISMDLFDPKSKKGMRTSARLISITQKEGRWAYQIQWNSCPEIVQSTSA
jgi:hypothetical protein